MSQAIRIAEFEDLSPAVRAFISKPRRLYINGEWVDGHSGKEIELWNPVTGKQDGILQTPVGQTPVDVRYDRTGTRLLVLGNDLTVQIWDVDRRKPVGRPIPVPSLSDVQGLDADGYLVLVEPTEVTDAFQLAFWDMAAGRQSGAVRLSTTYPGIYPVSDDGTHVRLTAKGGALPIAFPLTAAQWVEQLCRFTDRPFSAEEQGLLPPGVGVEQPCPPH